MLDFLTYGPFSSRIVSNNFSLKTLLFEQIVTAGKVISDIGKLVWRIVVMVGKLIHFISTGYDRKQKDTILEMHRIHHKSLE